MIFEQLKRNKSIDDTEFNEVYPIRIKKLAARHWTPVKIARKAAGFLVDRPNKRVLDIGSGAGKFCLVGAASTTGRFYGVEQREPLIKLSRKIAEKYKIDNVEFIHSNITEISFLDYDAFYFFNSFQENIDLTARIDKSIDPSEELYHLYTGYLKDQLEKTPIGTKLVTYWSNCREVPKSFSLESVSHGGVLSFWRKTA
ncbi:methyltransferase domain-containing protein [Flavobacterium zhairuonense]|uniref:class I SAM-dependent methyltransferase n=1 Tax=Flavobacterium zhairuonense TaxID=2493631 RepID=UPI0010521771|nr:methyltransferase domain-containing protein [Flavobacterium zhairuonense]KAF2508670.1 methyltransferase domain-containing protein [Flavobacterium zhairuonense]